MPLCSSVSFKYSLGEMPMILQAARMSFLTCSMARLKTGSILTVEVEAAACSSASTSSSLLCLLEQAEAE